MKTRLMLLALLLFGASAVRAQYGSFGKIPIEITQEGESRWENGVAIAERNVVIHYGTTSIYTDYAQYNPETRDVLALGNVRIYRNGSLFVGDRALYNLETKVLRTANFRGGSHPYLFQAETVNSLEGNAFQIDNGILTTSDSSKPDYYIKAGTTRIYPNDHVVLTNATLYVGKTPVFWFPWLYQSLEKNSGFSFTPGYGKGWGAYVLTQYGIPIAGNLAGVVRLDLRSTRGAAGGFDLRGTYGTDDTSWMRFSSYFINDQDPSNNTTALAHLPVDPSRYRIAFQDQTFFTPDIYASVDINKLSDDWILHDFFPGEYRTNRNPDNVVAITDRSENYSLTGMARFALNDFLETTERLPEVVLDIKRQPLFGSQIFYQGQTSAANLRRNFPSYDAPPQSTAPAALEKYLNARAHGTRDEILAALADYKTALTSYREAITSYALTHPGYGSYTLKDNTLKYEDFGTVRLDTFHQLVAPQTLGGWLSVVPRVGFRSTYYSHGAAEVSGTLLRPTAFDAALDLTDMGRSLLQRQSSDPVFRHVFNAGVESSFKLSREWEEMQSRFLGLDGLRHVFQPYADFSFVRTNKEAQEILQFDRINPSTQLPPIDFPQFNMIDTLPNWSILRLGIRNRLETRRDDTNFTWLEMETFVNANLENPNFPVDGWNNNSFSNVFTKIAWTPVPWAFLQVDSQLPLLADGFEQVNTTVGFMPTDDLRLSVSHRYLNGNLYFADSSNITFNAYYRINDNWGFAASEAYELNTQTLQTQNYEIYRDLSSWIVSLGLIVRQNYNATTNQRVFDTGVVFTFTLKDIPSVGIPLHFDPSDVGNDSGGSGKNK